MPRPPGPIPSPSPPRSPAPLNWAKSKTVGQLTEIAVLAPIKQGRIPGERCTYEERARLVVDAIQDRVTQGLPTSLDRVPTIHFGRIVFLRPEQYLVDSSVPGLNYLDGDGGHVAAPAPHPINSIPAPIDDYSDGLQGVHGGGPPPTFRSWMLVLVSFDGDLKAYFRDIATFVDSDFDSILRNCEGYPTVRNFETFWGWIRTYQANVDLFYPRYPDLSMVRIKELQDFRRRFDEFVAEVRRAPDGKRVASMEELFDKFLRLSQQYASNFPAEGGTFESTDV